MLPSLITTALAVYCGRYETSVYYGRYVTYGTGDKNTLHTERQLGT